MQRCCRKTNTYSKKVLHRNIFFLLQTSYYEIFQVQKKVTRGSDSVDPPFTETCTSMTKHEAIS